ncbi:hypothetical protein EVAR_99035_1 [Eumeta japonica]|uniref:Uncharacterized protein n=1 Tax=Eumeta variegata TaxID=151549 RepID=A0A4C1Y1C3_EUMVA|nr:hypothetical protein EVAR_99035_1 [Eumeta japonica]
MKVSRPTPPKPSSVWIRRPNSTPKCPVPRAGGVYHYARVRRKRLRNGGRLLLAAGLRSIDQQITYSRNQKIRSTLFDPDREVCLPYTNYITTVCRISDLIRFPFSRERRQPGGVTMSGYVMRPFLFYLRM